MFLDTVAAIDGVRARRDTARKGYAEGIIDGSEINIQVFELRRPVIACAEPPERRFNAATKCPAALCRAPSGGYRICGELVGAGPLEIIIGINATPGATTCDVPKEGIGGPTQAQARGREPFKFFFVAVDKTGRRNDDR